MIRYDEALARIEASIPPLRPVERAPLRLLGCHLAAPVVAPIPLPAFDDSAMDGYATRAAAVEAARRDAPVRLALGDAALPIATGDAIPEGMDAVVPLEWTRRAGDAIEVLLPVARGANIRRRGEDVQVGEVVAPAGMRIDTGVVLAAASLGVERVRAHPRVRCAVLPVGQHLAAGRPDATGPAIVAALRAWGAPARLLPPATGDATAVASRIAAALRGVDLLVTAGAASVGEDDVVPAAIEAIGAKALFHGVAIKPGKPIGVARHEGRTILVLPGSPTAALAGLEGIGRAVHARLAGAGEATGRGAPSPVSALLGRALHRRKGKTGLLRGEAVLVGSRLVFLPAAKQGPSQISAVVGQNALALLPPDREALPAGATLSIHLLEPPRTLPIDGRLFAVCGWSGAGKTWVVEQLVRRLAAAGLRVATVKHHGSGGALESAEKDTARHRAAGAVATALVGEGATLVRQGDERPLEPLAADHLAAGADVVLAEGFKRAPAIPKIEVAARGRERVAASPLFALVTDGPADDACPAFQPDADGMDALAAHLLRRVRGRMQS